MKTKNNILQEIESLKAEIQSLKESQLHFSDDEISFIKDGSFTHKKNIQKICEEIKEIARYNTVKTTYDYSPGRLNLNFDTYVKCGNKIYASFSRRMDFSGTMIFTGKIILKYKGKHYTGEEIEDLHRFLLQLVKKGE